jgi:PAS domain S-box-containing protein
MEASIKQNGNPEDSAARDQRWSLRAFTASPAAMSITRLSDEHIIEVNQSFLDMFGYTRNEVVGRSSAELGLWVNRDVRQAMAGEFAAGTPVRDVASAFRKKSGEEGFGLGSFEPIEVDGEPCILSVAQDITAARRTREALLLNERRFRSLVMASAQIVWSGDPKGLPVVASGITDVQSHSWTGFTGQSDEEMQGHGWEEAVHPEDRRRMREDFRRAYAARSIYETEYRVRRHDGVYRRFAVRAIPALTPEGEIEEWFGAMTDITDQREAERDAARANVAVWLMAEVSAAATLALDFEATMRRVAQATVPRFADLCMLDVFDEGKLRRVAVVNDGRPGVAESLESVPPDLGDPNDIGAGVIASSRPVFYPSLTGADINVFGRNEDQLRALRSLDLRSIIRVPLLTSGDAFGAITFGLSGPERLFDETDLSLAQELGRRIALSLENARLYSEAREAESKLREANRVKDEFLGMMSHELRTPITVVRGGARVLMLRGDEMARDARIQLIADIEQESARLARMLDDLLALSRLDLDQRPDPEPVLLTHLIPELLRTQSNAALAARVHFTIEDDLPIVSADPGYIGHVMGNLLSNAFKYSPADSPIEVRVQSTGAGSVAIRVLDSGVGLAPEDFDHVFERFYRSDRTAALAGGAGMGLAVCKRLVEAMSGEIWVRARDTQGLEVGFSLPIAEPESTIDGD